MEIQDWFARHVTLFDESYTLDYDQARAVADRHQNTLVVARAGSGKTRVIVAKVAFLMARCQLSASEIMIFMFNRAAATEVNQRIAAVKVDGKKLVESIPQIASTFHKFALDIAKSFGYRPKIIGENEHGAIISQALDQTLQKLKHKVSPNERKTLLSLTGNFINRAGQKFPGTEGLESLQNAVARYVAKYKNKPNCQKAIFWHRISLLTYEEYVRNIRSPQIDFNMLMALASEILEKVPDNTPYFPTKYIMIDEYQDFSYLFFRLTLAIRRLTSNAHLFAVGDDWQAINRFAGSDVNYFINFKQYFSENQITIPLATNYRSCRKIVDVANQFMLKHYDSSAIPAVAKNRKLGKVIYRNPAKTRFDISDYNEDSLADGRYLEALLYANPKLRQQTPRQLSSVAKLFKTVTKIILHHPKSEFMLLHRHNFTTFPGVDLPVFEKALKFVLQNDGILSASDFNKRIRCMTMHKSKGLEAEIVILLEMEAKVIRAMHPLATVFELFDDTSAAEHDDQSRLIYVALTRAKQKLYVLTSRRELITK